MWRTSSMRCVAYLALRGAADIIAAGALLVSGVRVLSGE